jgi:S-layer protein (TIGR01564 family)
MTPTGTVSSGGTGGTMTTQQVLPITADVVKLDTDSDINTAIQNNDVIIVGGPCINHIAAQALGKTYPACGASSGIPENAALIQLFTDKFATGKTALLVAGWEAANTDLAARIVQTGFPGATSTQLAGTTLTVTGTVASPSYS